MLALYTGVHFVAMAMASCPNANAPSVVASSQDPRAVPAIASCSGFFPCLDILAAHDARAILFGTNSDALILRRSCRFSFFLSRWERAGVRVLSSNVPQRKAPSPGLRPASPRGRGKRDNARLVGHMACRTPFPHGRVQLRFTAARRLRSVLLQIR